MYTQYNVYIYDYNNVFVLCHDTTSEFNQIPYTVHKFQNKTTKKRRNTIYIISIQVFRLRAILFLI